LSLLRRYVNPSIDYLFPRLKFSSTTLITNPVRRPVLAALRNKQRRFLLRSRLGLLYATRLRHSWRRRRLLYTRRDTDLRSTKLGCDCLRCERWAGGFDSVECAGVCYFGFGDCVNNIGFVYDYVWAWGCDVDGEYE